MITPQAVVCSASSAASPASCAGGAPPEEAGLSFRDVLSALNPLQYVPVVGTIYRAITGDRPPESMRVMGSMLAGGLMGGPVGAAISAVSSLLQHVTGIDLDDVAHDVLQAVGLADDPPSVVVSAPAAAPPTLARSATAAEGPALGWQGAAQDGGSPPPAALRRQALAAYGQTLFTYGAGAGHA